MLVCILNTKGNRNDYKKWIYAYILFFMVYFPEATYASSVRIESSDAIYRTLSESQAQDAANLVRLHGYSCRSISKFKPLIMSNGYHIICNGWRYSYEIKDVGGRYVVVPD